MLWSVIVKQPIVPQVEVIPPSQPTLKIPPSVIIFPSSSFWVFPSTIKGYVSAPLLRVILPPSPEAVILKSYALICPAAKSIFTPVSLSIE
jgi:hypothetical protein